MPDRNKKRDEELLKKLFAYKKKKQMARPGKVDSVIDDVLGPLRDSKSPLMDDLPRNVAKEELKPLRDAGDRSDLLFPLTRKGSFLGEPMEELDSLRRAGKEDPLLNELRGRDQAIDDLESEETTDVLRSLIGGGGGLMSGRRSAPDDLGTMRAPSSGRSQRNRQDYLRFLKALSDI
jgi:hypothetical protein